MEHSKPPHSIAKIGITTGLAITVVLIIYFMVMKSLGLAQVIELRLFNVVFVAIGVFYGISKYKKAVKNSEEFYLNGWAQGFYIIVVSTISFALFMGIYIPYFDTALLKHIQSFTNLGEFINGLSIFISLLVEGFVSGIIVIFAAMQYFKRETNFKENADSTSFLHKDKSGMGSKV